MSHDPGAHDNHGAHSCKNKKTLQNAHYQNMVDKIRCLERHQKHNRTTTQYKIWSFLVTCVYYSHKDRILTASIIGMVITPLTRDGSSLIWWWGVHWFKSFSVKRTRQFATSEFCRSRTACTKVALIIH